QDFRATDVEDGEVWGRDQHDGYRMLWRPNGKGRSTRPLRRDRKPAARKLLQADFNQKHLRLAWRDLLEPGPMLRCIGRSHPRFDAVKGRIVCQRPSDQGGGFRGHPVRTQTNRDPVLAAADAENDRVALERGMEDVDEIL